MRFFSCPKDHLAQKIKFLCQKVCPVARVGHTDGQTDTHESDYWGHPLRVSGFFPSTYHQGSAQYSSVLAAELYGKGGHRVVERANNMDIFITFYMHINTHKCMILRYTNKHTQ